MDVFGQILQFTPLFIANFVEILPHMYGSSDIMVYQAHFKQVLNRFQADPSCLTIDKVKPQLCPIRRHLGRLLYTLPYRKYLVPCVLTVFPFFYWRVLMAYVFSDYSGTVKSKISAPFCHPMSVVNNSALLFFHPSHFHSTNNKLHPLLRVSK